MAVVEAQVRPEFAKEYPGLTPGRWYRVNQSVRELDSDEAHALHLESDGALVEVGRAHHPPKGRRPGGVTCWPRGRGTVSDNPDQIARMPRQTQRH